MNRDKSHMSERFLNTILDSIRDPFCIFDRKFRMVRINDAYARLKGRTSAEMEGKTCYEFLENRGAVCDTCVVEKTLTSGDPCAKEKRILLRDQSEVWVEIYTYPIISEDGGVSHVIEYTRDITDRKRSEEEKKLLIARLEYLSMTDSLTGLLNRRALTERIDFEMSRAKRYGSGLSIILCDVDDFKKINDTYGHHIGDRALRALCGTLLGAVRKADIVGRHGGDEFLFVLPETTLEGAERLAEKIRQAVEDREFSLAEGLVARMSLSLGVSCFDESLDDSDSLIKRCDRALYISKQSGKNRVRSLRPERS